eukprot:scaffold4062_cov31-Phaeocystis_antarctica.AAC.1
MGERRDHAAQGRAEQVGPAGQVAQGRFGVQHGSGLQRRSGLYEGEARLQRRSGLQQLNRAGSFGWRGDGGTRGGHTTMRTTRSSSCCTRLYALGDSMRVAAVRTRPSQKPGGWWAGGRAEGRVSGEAESGGAAAPW